MVTTRDLRATEILSLIAERRGEETSDPARLCAACAAMLPVTGVGVALMSAGGPTGVVLAATDGLARQLEELQFSHGEGPCVDASRSGRPVLQPDLQKTGVASWPAFGDAVLAAGIRAVFAFPLRVGPVQIGILDLYRNSTGLLTETELAEALAFADAATVVLLGLLNSASDELIQPIEDRAQVHQATGMISVQLGVGLVEALLRLRASAYAASRTVPDIAADVVSRRMRFDPSPR